MTAECRACQMAGIPCPLGDACQQVDAPLTADTPVPAPGGYMQRLIDRKQAFDAALDARTPAHPYRLKQRLPALYEWFVRDGDEHIVAPEVLHPPKPRRERKPRYYRPASYWQDQITRLEAEIASVSEPIVTDRAAAGGCALGPKRTARVQEREDRKLQRYVQLQKRLDHATAMHRAAVAREGRAS